MSYIEENGYFIFDGIKSSDYGVWIHGGGTYNAPKRRYKDYTVPGRNGTLTIDEGVFEEIEVVYPAFIARNFPENIEAFRNQLMSRSGYVRMTDSYHPDEYYLAKYMDGLDADVAPGGVGAQFNLTFKRDPRRFLVSGETPISVASSGSIANPTLFNSKPQIKITPKRGNLVKPRTESHTSSGIQIFSNGTTVVMSGTATGNVDYIVGRVGLPAGKYTLSGCPAGGTADKCLWAFRVGGGGQVALDTGNGSTFTLASYAYVEVDIFIRSGQTVDMPFVPRLIADESNVKTVTISDQIINVKSVGEYVVIDSEIQSCYRGYNNLNSQVAFTSNNFPVLKPGDNGITYSDNIESVEITPNWYIV